MARGSNPALKLVFHLLAAAIGYLMWSHRFTATDAIANALAAFSQLIFNQLRWFMSAKPAGVKLHIQLARWWGRAGIWCVTTCQPLYSWLSPFLETICAAAALLAPLVGASQTFRGLAWGVLIMLAPLELVYAASAALYRAHLTATATTWAAMRGTAHLPFFPGSGAVAEGSSSPVHLAAAALLFMPLLLTLPTTVWYYAYVSTLHLCCAAVVEALMAVARKIERLEGGTRVGDERLGVAESLQSICLGQLIGISAWRGLLTVFLPDRRLREELELQKTI